RGIDIKAAQDKWRGQEANNGQPRQDASIQAYRRPVAHYQVQADRRRQPVEAGDEREADAGQLDLPLNPFLGQRGSYVGRRRDGRRSLAWLRRERLDGALDLAGGLVATLRFLLQRPQHHVIE